MPNPLFILRKSDEILSLYGQRPKALSHYVREKLACSDRTKICDLASMMQRLIGCSISAEVVFFNDDGKELYTEFPELVHSYLALADDGQGDLWMLRLADGMMVFFDHGKTEEPITPLGINFQQFLQLADLIAQWEQFLNANPDHAAAQEPALWAEMKKIEPKLPKTYPFRLQ